MRDFQRPGRSAVFATSHPLAAHCAVDILQRGGNAIDAAIAGAVLLGICEPQMTGLGGDCFALFTPPGSSDVHALNGSGRAPAAASAAALRAGGHDAVPVRSAEAVTIPGAVDAFCRLSEDHGRLGLDGLLEPAIRYAEEGVPAAPRVAFDWQRSGQFLQGHGRTHFTRDGEPLAAGEMFRAPGQAEVLRRIARDGRDRAQRIGRLSHRGGFRGDRLRCGHPDFGQLQGNRACRASAERPGRHRDPDSEHPVSFRHRADGSSWGAAGAYRGGSDQAGV